MEKINAIPSIDSWLIKYQKKIYTKSTICEADNLNIQLNHQYKNLPSLMPIVSADHFKNIKLNTWL